MGKIFDIMKSIQVTPLSILVSLVLVIGLILFLPNDIATQLSINEFRGRYRIYLGPSFLILLFMVAARIIASIGRWIKNKIRKHRNEKMRLDMLLGLTIDEKELLSQFIVEGKNTVTCPIDDGVAGGLLAKRIIYRASNAGNLLYGFPYNLRPWARDHLEMFPALLDY